MKKIVLVIIDGLGDEKIPRLENKTPLEAAKTPNFDFLAKEGICGLMVPFKFREQEYPTSDVAHLALLGFDPRKYYLGRGVYEAFGAGVSLKSGDVALRVNFGTVDKNLKIINRRAGRIEKTESLIKALNKIKIEGVKFYLKKAFGHRAVLRIRSKKKLSSAIEDGDPHKVGVKVKKIKPKDDSESAKFTAKILNQYLEKAHQILENHSLNKKRKKKGLLPANFLLVRGAGMLKKIPSFQEKFSLKTCCVAGGTLYKGIGKALGMDLIKVKGANGKPNTNLKGKFLSAKKALKKYDFVFLHIKAADSLAEDGDFLKKKAFIERIDKNIIYLFEKKKPAKENFLLAVSADHSTSSLKKHHISTPVPILIFGNGSDKLEVFSEKACKNGKLKKFPSLNLIAILKKLR
ncbi:MAG: 2,3-bisphosphoglycerate-independent phosphoglycerate mutase [Candidatus Pacebacteria bacterium]|nr:2,3-bisphosphoglycerate-independent phosphoglycerate mutase [Candidatus Paceibacterota bacterium]